MPELRKDPIIDRWVIIASERGHRPSDFQVEEEPSGGGSFCPFCYGNETKTPAEVYALRPEGSPANTPGWIIRVVPNRYPALAIEGNLDRRGLGMFDLMNGVGAHEVIIETPDHQLNLCDSSQEQMERILTAYRVRLQDLRRDTRFRYMLIFRNYGRVAGASLAHPHSQLIALAITPRTAKEELQHAQAHYRTKERCIFCDLIAQEQELRKRVVFQSEHFIALSPFASRFPFEVHLFPLRHSHDFTEMTPEEEMALARALQGILRRLKEALGNPPYNYMIHTAPALHPRPGHPEYWGTIAWDYHWHIEIVPRLTEVAGFEWGTGFYINPVAPEEATLLLRDVA